MRIKERSIDDLLFKAYSSLLKAKGVVATRGGMLEVVGATLILTNPRARLSISESRGKIFSALGELLWYLKGSNALDHVSYYIKQYVKDAEDDGTIYGAYGPRLRPKGEVDQISNVVSLLSARDTSRRAVLQLYSAKDIAQHHKEIPCTCVIQFILRGGRLHALTYMRSNDAFLGLPHDIFSFTMIQEIIARRLNVQLGTYTHFVGSLHIYEEDIESANSYLREGWQAHSEMPAMPSVDVEVSLSSLLAFEQACRTEKKVPTIPTNLDKYWQDLALLLKIYRAKRKRTSSARIIKLIESLDESYKQYAKGIAKKAKQREAKNSAQAELF